MDGMDGFAGGMAVIGFSTFAIIGMFSENLAFTLANIGIVSAVVGFLVYNFPPAKIFMGDAGSMLLGFVIAALMILFAEKVPRWWMASIVAFGLPILDTATAVVRRLINKRPLFVSDRGHIYDQMIDRGIPLKTTVVICYALAGSYALTGVVMSTPRVRP